MLVGHVAAGAARVLAAPLPVVAEVADAVAARVRLLEGALAYVGSIGFIDEVISKICICFAKFCKFLAGSSSAVSKRNFARKYAFDNIFQALQDLHPFAPLQSQNFRKKIGLKNQQFL